MRAMGYHILPLNIMYWRGWRERGGGEGGGIVGDTQNVLVIR